MTDRIDAVTTAVALKRFMGSDATTEHRYTVGEKVMVFVPGHASPLHDAFGSERPATLKKLMILTHDSCGNSRTEYANSETQCDAYVDGWASGNSADTMDLMDVEFDCGTRVTSPCYLLR